MGGVLRETKKGKRPCLGEWLNQVTTESPPCWRPPAARATFRQGRTHKGTPQREPRCNHGKTKENQRETKGKPKGNTRKTNGKPKGKTGETKRETKGKPKVNQRETKGNQGKPFLKSSAFRVTWENYNLQTKSTADQADHLLWVEPWATRGGGPFVACGVSVPVLREKYRHSKNESAHFVEAIVIASNNSKPLGQRLRSRVELGNPEQGGPSAACCWWLP